MILHGVGLTDVGVTRDHNEDSLFVNNDMGLFVVCDGVGGQAAGEIASKMAVDIINDYMRKAVDGQSPFIGQRDENFTELTNQLASSIRLANQVVYESSKSTPALQGMGSTVVAVSTVDDKLCVAHAGDSRAYLIRDGKISQITNDHSLVMDQLREGLITEEQAEASEIKNIITRALGAAETITPEMNEIDLQNGDKILLCSDGLCNMLTDEAILDVAEDKDSLKEACEKLVWLANENGGKDNITVIISEVKKKGILGFFSKFAL